MMLTGKRDHLTRDDAITVAIIESAVPVFAAARRLLERFQAMIRQRNADGLGAWLDDASDGPMAGFARGLRADQPASLQRSACHGPMARPRGTSPSSSSSSARCTAAQSSTSSAPDFSVPHDPCDCTESESEPTFHADPLRHS
jgi:hypothetical protein